MITDAAKPIGGVAIVRLPAVKNAVNQGAITMFEVLDNPVSGLGVVVPEQKQRPNQLAPLRRHLPPLGQVL